jgi:hypothetical protein
MSRLETVILEVAKMQHTNTEMQNCIHDCTHCAQTCLSMASMPCLEVGGAHVESRHFRLMLDCAEICQTAANFMLRGSSHHTHVCAECADICEDCAQSCEQVGDMDDCVQACRQCAESCRKMAGVTV